MAEERLIDQDKDKKYRIRKNENGEDELVIFDGGDGDDGSEPATEYDVVTDDLSGQDLSEEAERAYDEWEENRQKETENLKAAARGKIDGGDFSGAEEDLKAASLLTEYDGELYFLLLKARTRNMTDFSDLDSCAETAEGVKENCDEAQKSELRALSAPLCEKIKEVKAQCDGLKAQSEDGKSMRRATFARDKRNALIAFACTAVPFLALFIVDMVFVSRIFADKDGLYIVLSIAFAAAAAVALIASLFTTHMLINALRKVRLNERDSSTQIGREYLTCNERLKKLNAVYSSFENDIS